MCVSYGSSPDIGQKELALDTILQLHNFLSSNVKNSASTQVFSLLGARPCTISTCKIALSYLPSHGFNRNNYHIEVQKQDQPGAPHFEQFEISKNDPNNPKYNLLVVSEAAKIALQEYKKQLEARQEEQHKSISHQALLPHQENSDSYDPNCALF